MSPQHTVSGTLPVLAKRSRPQGFPTPSTSKDWTWRNPPLLRHQSEDQARDTSLMGTKKAAKGSSAVPTPNTPAARTGAGDIAPSTSPLSSGMEDGAKNTASTRAISVVGVSEAMRGLALIPTQPPGSPTPQKRLVDRRFMMQPFKVAFITQKRCEALWNMGLGFRLEPGSVTIQEFLDRTQLARGGTTSDGRGTSPGGEGRSAAYETERARRTREALGSSLGGSCEEAGTTGDGDVRFRDWAGVDMHALDSDGWISDLGDTSQVLDSDTLMVSGSDACVDFGAVGCAFRDQSQDDERGTTGRGSRDGRGGAGPDVVADVQEWQRFRDMTMVYNTTRGWIFLYHVTEEAVNLLERIETKISCAEVGIPSHAMSPDTLAALEGMTRLFNEGPDIAISIEECVVKIVGTAKGVEDAAAALELVARSNERTQRLNGHWFWRGDATGGESSSMFPTYPMTPDACYTLDQAYARYLEDGCTTARYKINGLSYEANFTTMVQKNISTDRKRPIERLVPHRTEFPLARCPKETLSVTCFREGTTYTMVPVTEKERALVVSAVSQTLMSPVVKVEHIWNSFLWGHYAQNAKSIGNEMMLFHGAGSTALSQISRTGFDRRFAGCENGAVYGQGCYFARDASYASRFAFAAGGRQMIMAKVLVGKYTRGSSTMKRPPKVSSAGERTYDSTVDNSHTPTIFVAYKDWQAYPMYLITFRENKLIL